MKNTIPKNKIKSMRETFRQYPSNMRREIDEKGEGFMEFGCYKPLPCGCRVTGCGTIQLPFTVAQCSMHAAHNND